jgi:nitrile hydratase
MQDATAAIAELGFSGAQGEDMVVVENTPEVHNVVVCTLCSCAYRLCHPNVVPM